MRSKLFGGPFLPALVGLLPLLVPLLSGQEQQRGRRRAGREGVETVDLGVSDRKGAEIVDAPRGLTVSDSARPRRWPFLLPRADGSISLGSLRWVRGRGDQIVLATLTPDGKETARREVTPQFLEALRPVGLLDADGGARLFWTELVGDAPQLRTAREAGEGFTTPVTLTGGTVGGTASAPSPSATALPPIPHMNVEATLDAGGRIWVAWEQETPGPQPGARGSRDVAVAPFEPAPRDRPEQADRLGASILVGAGRFSDLDPGIVRSGDRLWIVWVAYGGRDYEIQARSLDPKTGALSEVLQVSADPASDDLHPTIAAAPNGDVWIAWDRIEIPDRGDSAPSSLRLRPRAGPLQFDVHVACIRGERVLVAGDGSVPGAPMLSSGGGLPRIGVDGSGRVWVAYHELMRLPRGKGDYVFPVLVQSLGSEGWSTPIRLDQRATIPEEPALAFSGGDAPSATVAFTLGLLGVGVATIAAPASPPTPTLVERARPESPPHFHPLEGRLDDPYVTGEHHFEIARGDERFHVYWGDLHRHSNVSRCSRGIEPAPSDRWEWGRDLHLCDFMALTDHCGQMDPLMAWHLDKLCWLYQSPTFCTLAGWEWSSREVGHHNVILKGRLSEMVGEVESLDRLYAKLPAGTFLTIPHHSADGKFPQDFGPVKDQFTRLIEVYQACRGSYEFDGAFRQSVTADVVGSFVQDALNDGHVFGIIASTDHGFGQSYACVAAKSLARAELFDALHARRTYGATTKGMLVDFRIDDALMGEQIRCEGAPRVRLHAIGASELADVTVFKDGQVWRTTRVGEPAVANALAPLRLVIRLPPCRDRPPAAWSFRIESPALRFEELEDRREPILRGDAPGFTIAAGTAGAVGTVGTPDPTEKQGTTGETEHGTEASAGAGGPSAVATFEWPPAFVPDDSTRDFALHVRGESDAELVVTTSDGEIRTTLGQLMRSPRTLASPAGECELSVAAGDAVVDLAKGLGTREFDAEWVDDSPHRGESWYYARLIQTDGEMAWSSPIFVSRP